MSKSVWSGNAGVIDEHKFGRQGHVTKQDQPPGTDDDTSLESELSPPFLCFIIVIGQGVCVSYVLDERITFYFMLLY